MKIEKIKNYNQKLLAILGTIIVAFALVGLIIFISISITEYGNYYDDGDEIGILSNDEIDKLQKENKRVQVISYQMPKLIDTLNQVYIIPVSHKTLDDPEEINPKLLGLVNVSNEYSPVMDQRYSRGFYGNFNNIIVYNQKLKKAKKLFETRVNFDKINVEYFSDDIFLLFKVAEKDSYKDGVINLQDFKSLYIYSVKESILKKVEDNGMDVFSCEFLNNSKDLIIQFGIDKNGNGTYEEYNEPTILKKYNFKNEKLINIIEENINSELQKLLEGTEETPKK